MADYPFTTLVPNLGVVNPQPHRSFVIADIPGLIEGAADGAGLGIRFLKHLERCRVLLHVIDVLPADGSDPVDNAVTILGELEQYSEALANKPRWLVFNKIDLLLDDEVEEVANRVIEALEWEGPVHHISAFTKLNTDKLCNDILVALEDMPRDIEATQEQEDVEFKWDTYHEQTIAQYENDDFDDDDFDDDDDDDDYGVEVVYQK